MLINVLHILRNPHLGGSEVLVKNIINNNTDKRFSHYILYSENGPLLQLVESAKRNRLIYCRFTNKISFILKLRKIIKENSFFIIHSHQPIDSLYALLASVFLKKRIVMTYHGYPIRYTDKKNPLSPVITLIINWSKKYICLNLFVSKEILNYYKLFHRNIPENKMKLLYNGIQVKQKYHRKSLFIHGQLGLEPNSLVIGMVGSFTTHAKDQLTICKAMSGIFETYKKLHLVFIGQTEGGKTNHYKECKDYCSMNGMEHRVHFLGQREDIDDIIHSFDIYIHSSRYETFGMALVEAMMSGIPCIASDIPTFREVSVDGRLVVLFRVGDPADLKKKIIREIENLESIETKNRISFASIYANEQFSLSKHISDLHKYYQNCLE